MLKQLLAFALLTAGLIGVMPYIPQVNAILSGQVNLPDAELATFRVTSPSEPKQIIACTVGPITLAKNTNNKNLPAFKCWSNHPQSITISWVLVAGNGVLDSVSTPGTVTLLPTDTALCRNVRLSTPNAQGSGNAVVKGVFRTTDGNFAGEIFFNVPITVTSGGKGGAPDSYSCP